MTGYAIITGATSGIGEEFAHQLAARGVNLFITGRRTELLESLQEKLSKLDIDVLTHTADLSIDEGIESLVSAVENLEVEYLINNAGFANIGSFQNVPMEKHQAMLQVHITAVVGLTHAVLPGMIAQNRGVIINVASMAGLLKKGSNNLYGPTKAFLISFSYNLNVALGNYDIIVQALCPGYTYSGFHKTEEYKRTDRDAYSTIPTIFWQTSESVVSYSLKRLKKGRVVVIPRLLNRIALRLVNWGIIRR